MQEPATWSAAVKTIGTDHHSRRRMLSIKVYSPKKLGYLCAIMIKNACTLLIGYPRHTSISYKRKLQHACLSLPLLSNVGRDVGWLPCLLLCTKLSCASLRSIKRPTPALHVSLTRRVSKTAKTGGYQTLLVCVVRVFMPRRRLPPRPQVKQEMMISKSDTMALIMAFNPAAMALTMAMMQLPIVRKTDLICSLLALIMKQIWSETYAGDYSTHICGCSMFD